jgi:hypothetical protein
MDNFFVNGSWTYSVIYSIYGAAGVYGTININIDLYNSYGYLVALSDTNLLNTNVAFPAYNTNSFYEYFNAELSTPSSTGTPSGNYNIYLSNNESYYIIFSLNVDLRSASIGVASSEIFTSDPFIASLYEIQIDRNSTSSGGGGSCVYAFEPILTNNYKYKFAKDLKIGDQILTYNFSENEIQKGIVTNIYKSNGSLMYIIDNVLYLAPDQMVWTERGWVEAQNLTLNDSIYDVITGNWADVYLIYEISGNFEMYDFTININGNYIGYPSIIKDVITPC